MKKFLPAFALVLALSACNSDPKPTTTVPANDTTGLAAFQQQKVPVAASELTPAATPAVAALHHSSVRHTAATRNSTTSSSGATTSGSSTGTSGGTATATPKRKGISGTAKGAIIGGVAGAAGGAIINKKNRAVGAIVGGVVGAGAGALIGNKLDKKN
ncbi:glycine zipper domain-containing protein [Flaviaesturariibacter aridisoli]|uniref:Glycine zipper domain-containing protein n=1 Tax=Flaviaesturariibacter aridisoli TaxID=2545761 RepID=A0A4R4DVU4_9BACT|nr:glycine zipper domain-containing protein [Flaviaesturariibacter aridisoli]TCZ64778.1 hypothetical protein E0486_17910 [Flaviaesturariibacter aridisoli]